MLVLDEIRGLRRDPAVNSHFAGHDGGLGLLAAREKSPLDERLIESNPSSHEITLSPEPARVAVIVA